jgi:hypothetical protein
MDGEADADLLLAFDLIGASRARKKIACARIRGASRNREEGAIPSPALHRHSRPPLLAFRSLPPADGIDGLDGLPLDGSTDAGGGAGVSGAAGSGVAAAPAAAAAPPPAPRSAAPPSVPLSSLTSSTALASANAEARFEWTSATSSVRTADAGSAAKTAAAVRARLAALDGRAGGGAAAAAAAPGGSGAPAAAPPRAAPAAAAPPRPAAAPPAPTAAAAPAPAPPAPGKLAAAAAREAETDATEEFSKLRIAERAVPSADIRAALAGRRVFSMRELSVTPLTTLNEGRPLALGNSAGGGAGGSGPKRECVSWVCIGVLGARSEPRASSSGGTFLTWTLTDFRSEITVFLFGEA